MIFLKRGFTFLVILFIMFFCACSGNGMTAPETETETSGAVQNTPAAMSPAATPNPIPTTAPDSAASPTEAPDLTTTPVPSPTDTSLTHAPYKSGDKGDDVKLLQNMLITLGFDPGDVDGSFGAQLEKAVRNFQLYVGLDADGIAGQQTIDALTDRYDGAMSVVDQANQPLAGLVIGIDPGHQRNGNSGLEPVKPGSDDMKKKVSSGTAGRFTGVPEYVINLQVSLKLKAALESLGAKVVMTRETHGVDISNAERATMMNKANVDCWLRIHANGSDDPETHGMFILAPAKGSMATDETSVQEKSVALAEALLKAALKTTGAKDLGVVARSDQTGFGWSKVPVCNIEMGHMTNKTEDFKLVSESYQKQIVNGLVDGFVAYFQ